MDTLGLSPCNVLCVCHYARGHLLPMLNVARACVAAGHKVTLACEDFDAAAVQKLAEAAGASFKPIATCGMTLEGCEELFRRSDGDEIPFLPLARAMKSGTLDVARECRPDVVLCDFATVAGWEAASALGLPLLINMPGPACQFMDMVGAAEPHTYRQLGGVHVRFSAFSLVRLAIAANLKGVGALSRLWQAHAATAKILVHSFWGLESPAELPPQVKMIGPVLPAAGELARRFREGHPALHAWLHAEGAAPTVVVTTGSVIALHEWQVRAVFFAVKEAGLRAVWGLREAQQGFLPNRDDPAFWVSPWLPQAELLADDNIRAVVTHCGWGGTLECLSAGKPVVCFPFFGDQPKNARILVKAGCGELITDRLPPLTFGWENKYKEGAFTAASAARVLRKVVEDPRYARAARRMQRAARATGGAAEAAREVEWSARYGNDHLGSRHIHRTWGGNPFRGALALGVAAAAGVLLAACGLLGARAPRGR